ncbi:unnamed protein product, partial [Durusdinium trenchii]
ATKLLRGNTPECPCAQNADAARVSVRLASAALVETQARQSPQATWTAAVSSPMPELKVPPEVPQPRLGPPPPPPPPAIPSLPPVPNVDPEDIPLQSMEGPNLQSWYTVPPSVAELANQTRAPSMTMNGMASMPAPPSVTKLMPRLLPAPKEAEDLKQAEVALSSRK